MNDERDLIPQRVVVRGRGKGDAITIEPRFVKPIRLFRGVTVELQVPKEKERVFNFNMSPIQEARYFDRVYPQRRLQVFADKVTKHFDLPRKAARVRYTRGAQLLHIHLWEGPGKKEDYEKMKAVMAYVQKNARKI